MKLTRSINLNGVVLTIDEDAYLLLKDYLDDIEHRLPVVHADGFGTLELTRVDTHDAAAYRFRHIGACVDRHDKDADCPDA